MAGVPSSAGPRLCNRIARRRATASAAHEIRTPGRPLGQDHPVEPAEARRAVTAAIAAARGVHLVVDDTVVLNDSNRLVVRLLPCDVVARVVPLGYRVFRAAIGTDREVDVMQRLAAADA